MKIVVCIKQVPDLSSTVDTGRSVINAYDASALEAALVMAEGTDDSIHLISVGPASAAETLRKALAMGATDAELIEVDDEVQLDSMATAELLASRLGNLSFDLVLCGKQAQDTDAGLTGGMLAALLELPYVTNAVELTRDGAELRVTRQGDDGGERLKLHTPCLVTCSNDMNDPRIPTLRGIMEAKRKTLVVEAASDVPVPTTRVIRLLDPPSRPRATVLEGEPAETVVALCDALSSETDLL